MSFVISKTSLAPIKTLTIPCLELQAAVVAARLKTKILEGIDFEVEETHFWSDSKIVLHYLRDTQRRFNMCVSHRVAEIAPKSDVREWGHIPGTMNVADDCAREKEIHSRKRWIRSPQLLMLPEEEWSSSKEDLQVNESELKVTASVLTSLIIPSMIVVERGKYSTWKRLIGLYTRWIRYKFNLTCKVKRVSPPPERQTKNLTADDLEEALSALCKIAQVESFKQEYKDLQASWALSSKSPLLPLRPLLTEGIVRVGGHLDKAPIPFEARHQVVLSPKHPLSRLLVQDLQKKHFHVGREHTLALVRRQFWIPRGKYVIRKIVNDCLHCKRRREKPEIPVMASLPKD